MKTALTLVILLAAPALAGCFGGEPEETSAASVPASAADAGAVDGPAPAAAKTPYQVQDAGAEAVTVYPLAMQTNPAKPPYTETFEGQYSTQECLPTGGGLPLGGLGLARGGRFFDVSEAFATGDVFSYDLQMTYTNTDQSWAELHLWHQLDGAGGYWNPPTSETRGEVVMNFTGQGFIASEDFMAAVGVDCWFGQVTSPIPFVITLTVTFAEGAVPSAQPVLVEVPDGATRLFVSGLALDGARGVTSHYRVFAPDDSLLCECALSSDESTDAVDLPGPGAYVVLVDHTENGFVALALDAEPAGPLRALAPRFETFPLAGSDGGPVDEVLQITLESTPLGMGSWVFAPGDIEGPPDAGAGQNLKIVVANARGDVLRMAMAGYVTFHAGVPDMFVTNDWYAIPMDGEWEFFQDHHAYDLGGHSVSVKADEMRGQAVLFAQFYDRAS